MASKALNGVFQRLRALAAMPASRAYSDRELLERFLAAEDEAAFTALVERHGPMIHGVCRRLLRDRHEADDACQATFLVLARKARSVRKQASLASWLHGVAYRISLSLRRQRARRLSRERAICKSAVHETDNGLTWQEFRAALDEELQRLPERYRAPLILCYLEGKTRDEAALQLGSTPGALHGLLNRGRKLLRERLTKRGLTLSGVLFATALGETAVRAALAPALVVASARAALALFRSDTVAPALIGPNVLSLVKEASKAMFMTKLKIGAALVVAAGIFSGIVGGALTSVSLAQDAAATQPKSTPAGTQNIESDEAFIRRISKDLRGMDPSPAEVHFFVANKDGNRRQKLIDLFIQERHAKARETAQKLAIVDMELYHHAAKALIVPMHTQHAQVTAVRRLATLQGQLFKDLNVVANDKKEVATITQKYLDQLQEYVKAHPKNEDVADAMQQIALIYRSQGKTVEADAWRDKLLKEHPKSPAAKALQQTSNGSSQQGTLLYNPTPLLIQGALRYENPSQGDTSIYNPTTPLMQGIPRYYNPSPAGTSIYQSTPENKEKQK
jgi:RNA polymerase sigma factor (sigma-70 family)